MRSLLAYSTINQKKYYPSPYKFEPSNSNNILDTNQTIAYKCTYSIR